MTKDEIQEKAESMGRIFNIIWYTGVALIFIIMLLINASKISDMEFVMFALIGIPMITVYSKELIAFIVIFLILYGIWNCLQ